MHSFVLYEYPIKLSDRRKDGPVGRFFGKLLDIY